MGQTAAALRYAEALYALAKDAGRTGAVLAEVAAVKAALDGDPGAWPKLLHPRIQVPEKDAFLRAGALKGRDLEVSNLFRLVVARRREGILPDFFRAYLEVHEKNEGILRVEVETASPLGDAEREVLRAKVAEATGKTVVLEVRCDPALLGGMRFLIGSRLLDGSVKSRLDRIQKGLRTVGIAES